MLNAIPKLDREAVTALIEAGELIGLPPDGAEIARLLARVNDRELETISDAWRQAWIAQDGYLRFPDSWTVDVLRERPWSMQRRVMRAVMRHRKVAVHSSYGIGKSFVASRIAAHWLLNHPPGDAWLVTTAPTAAQVRAITWREIGIAYQKASRNLAELGLPTPQQLGHRMNLTEWWVGKELVGFGRRPALTGTSAAFQGIHARRVLVILEEAGGIPVSLMEDAEKLVTSEHSRILAIGNPTHEGSYWHQICVDPGWFVMHVSAFDSPNFTGETVDPGVEELLTSQIWVNEQARKYGTTSPRYQQQVLGIFSRDRTMTVVPLDWARACIRPADDPAPAAQQEERPWVEAHLARLQHGEDGTPTVSIPQIEVVLGVDPAGGGSDWTVIRERRGQQAGRMWRTQTGEPREQVDLIEQAARETGASRIVVDSVGVGYGLVELIRQRVGGWVRVQTAGAAEQSDVVQVIRWARRPELQGSTMLRWDLPEGDDTLEWKDVFANKRAERWWAARERCMLAADTSYRPIVPYVQAAWDLTVLEVDPLTGRQALAWGTEDPDPTLDELCAPGYEHVVRAKATVIKVESKEELRRAARLGGSSDHADALMLAFEPTPPPAPPPPMEYGGLAVLTGNTGAQSAVARRPTPLAQQGSVRQPGRLR